MQRSRVQISSAPLAAEAKLGGFLLRKKRRPDSVRAVFVGIDSGINPR